MKCSCRSHLHLHNQKQGSEFVDVMRETAKTVETQGKQQWFVKVAVINNTARSRRIHMNWLSLRFALSVTIESSWNNWLKLKKKICFQQLQARKKICVFLMPIFCSSDAIWLVAEGLLTIVDNTKTWMALSRASVCFFSVLGYCTNMAVQHDNLHRQGSQQI